MPDPGRRPSLHLVEADAAPPDCATCPQRETLLAAGRCVPGDTCLIAHSGRQIDRFLRHNPEYAEACLDDNFWERRAIAVRYVPLERISALVHDPDEVVRRAVAIRLPAAELTARFGVTRYSMSASAPFVRKSASGLPNHAVFSAARFDVRPISSVSKPKL